MIRFSASSIRLKIYSLLLIGVLVSSSAAILVRWTGDVSSSVIAFYRLIISAAILLIYSKFNSRVHKNTNKPFHWHFIIAGLFLAFHFITWISAVKMTSIANAIFLGNIHPVFAVLASIIFLKEFPDKRSIPVFLVSIIGMFLIVSTDFGLKPGLLTGDISAIFSAMFFAIYILIARIHRNTIDIIRYLGIIYTIAAIVCLIYILFNGYPLYGFSSTSWLMLVLLALGPSLTGHSLLNWASRHIEIFKVNLTMLLEPVLASIAGMLLFFEYPNLNFYYGAILILFALGYLIYIEGWKKK